MMAWAGRKITSSDILTDFGELSAFIGVYELKMLERWLIANKHSEGSFRHSSSMHIEMGNVFFY